MPLAIFRPSLLASLVLRWRDKFQMLRPDAAAMNTRIPARTRLVVAMAHVIPLEPLRWPSHKKMMRKTPSLTVHTHRPKSRVAALIHVCLPKPARLGLGDLRPEALFWRAIENVAVSIPAGIVHLAKTTRRRPSDNTTATFDGADHGIDASKTSSGRVLLHRVTSGVMRAVVSATRPPRILTEVSHAVVC